MYIHIYIFFSLIQKIIEINQIFVSEEDLLSSCVISFGIIVTNATAREIRLDLGKTFK